jgi:hypothetical protein
LDRYPPTRIVAPWYGGMTVTITIAARTRPATCSNIARVSSGWS